MRITAAGNVGIGTTSPCFKLDVAGTLRAVSGVSNNMVVETTGGTNEWARLWMITPSQMWSWGISQNFNGNQLYLADNTFNQFRMTVQPAGGAISFPPGNVGVVTTNPASKLHVAGELTLDATAPILHTGSADAEQHRYLHLINSPAHRRARRALPARGAPPLGAVPVACGPSRSSPLALAASC